MYKVYGMNASGNCIKVRMLLDHLGLTYKWREVDIFKGESRTPEFLAMNPIGRVPTLEIEPGVHLPESNAILYYLADNTPYWPRDRLARAHVLKWMFFEQYSHEPHLAVARFIKLFLPADHDRQADLPRLHERGYQALDVMEQHLSGQPFFGNDQYTIADIALYPYTTRAESGGFSLKKYPAVREWFTRVESQPGFVKWDYPG